METARNTLHLDFDDLEIIRFYHITSGKILRYTPNTLYKALKYEWIKIIHINKLVFPEHIRTLSENFCRVTINFVKKTATRNSGLFVTPVSISHKLCDLSIWPNKTPYFVYEQSLCENCTDVKKVKNGLINFEGN